MTLIHKLFWYNGDTKDCWYSRQLRRCRYLRTTSTSQPRIGFTYAEDGGRCCGSIGLDVACLKGGLVLVLLGMLEHTVTWHCDLDHIDHPPG